MSEMTCPLCNTGILKAVKDSRPHLLEGLFVVKRRRQCSCCKKQSTTIEIRVADLPQIDSHAARARFVEQVKVARDALDKALGNAGSSRQDEGNSHVG